MILEVTVDPDIDIALLPLEFSLDIPQIPPDIPMPNIPDLSFDFGTWGIQGTFVCPGFPECGREDEACTFRKRVGYKNLTIPIPLKIPELPSIPILVEATTFRLSLPPAGYNPKYCPNYNRKNTEV